MRIDLFDYELPADRIAQAPVDPRDSARLLDLTDVDLADRAISDLPSLLRPGDLLVFNDTRVIPARLTGRRGGAKVEVTLHKRETEGRWAAFARPARKLKTGDLIEFDERFAATVREKRDAGEVALDFDMTEEALHDALGRHGVMPLPPYIKRAPSGDDRDRDSYQTIFASRPGAVAAPTASLHFTDRLLTSIRARGVTMVAVTLHVGAGTFLPVKVEDTDDHGMHAEWGEIGPEAAAAIAATRANGGRVLAAGTTTLRILEAAAAETGEVDPWSGETSLFITPGYRFRVVDMLLTNFHLPRSTLLMLVSAFVGRRRILDAYAHAIASGYRFFSYGDACLLSRVDGVDGNRSEGERA